MTIAVLSDIHSNFAALQAVIADAEKRSPDMWLFLGDYITDCPFPHRTIEFLRGFAASHRCLFIRGNREDYMLRRRESPQPWKYGSKYGALLYCYEDLTDSDLDWLAGMPISLRAEIPGCEPLMMCHGSPENSSYLFHTETPEAEAMISRLGEFGVRLMLCGHSHIPYIFRRGDCMLVNPGALGMPVNRQTRAQYALLTYNGGFRPEIISVDYDIGRTVEEFRQSGLLEKSRIWGRGLIATLRTGVNYTVDSVRLVEKLSEQTGLPVTDESLWERAAEELDIPPTD